MARFTITSLLAALALATAPATAQFDRETAAPTDGAQTFFNYTPQGIGALVSQGYRLSDIEVTVATASTIRFSGTAVRNTGAYATAWWWYYGVSPTQLLSYAQQHNARLIDVERYVVGNSVHYAGIMVPNSGPDAVSWYFWTEVPYSGLSNLLSTTQTRMIDIEHHQSNGQNRLTVLAIRNQGEHARAWWYYVDYDLPYIQSRIAAHHARPIDLERIGPDRWMAILVDDSISPWWYYYGQTAASVTHYQSYHHARTIDLEMYLDGGTPRYVAIMVDDFENFRPYGTPCSTAIGPLEQDVIASSGFKGTTVNFRAQNVTAGSVGVMNIGVQQTAILLTPFGFPGCSLYTDPLASAPFSVGGTNQVVVPVGVPNDASLVGAEFFTQFAALGRTSAGIQLAASNGIATTIRG